jgi:hypothetical protein
MLQAKRASKGKRRSKAAPVLGIAGVSLAMAGGGASASAVGGVADMPSHNPTPRGVITLGEEEISDVRLPGLQRLQRLCSGQGLQRLRRLWLRLLPVVGILPNLLDLSFPITLQDAGRHGRVSNPAIDVLFAALHTWMRAQGVLMAAERVADPTKKCRTTKRRTRKRWRARSAEPWQRKKMPCLGGAELWRRLCVLTS